MRKRDITMTDDYRPYVNSFNGRLGARVFKYIVNNSKVVSKGQGVLSLECQKLWEMGDKEFESTFGVKLDQILDRE